MNKLRTRRKERGREVFPFSLKMSGSTDLYRTYPINPLRRVCFVLGLTSGLPVVGIHPEMPFAHY
jgi:hypothetical protein